MPEEEQDDEDLQIMWGTVTEITKLGSAMLQLDDGGEVLIPKFWTKVWGHDPDSLTVGTRMRCVVEVEWKPEYTAKAILTVVHEGKKSEEPSRGYPRAPKLLM